MTTGSAATISSADGDAAKCDVFISYSRHDQAFVRQLNDALDAGQRRAWVDWEGIPPTADWLREIFAAIESADTFVFVLSQASLASEVCTREVEHAVECRKRLVPLVLGEVEATRVPDALRRLNWIFCRQASDFDTAFRTLVQAIETDLEWVRDHTRLLVRAVEWRDERREASLLLRGADLREAESWLSRGADRDPKPTPLHQEYIIASRTQETRRSRRLLAAVATGMVIASALAVLAWVQRQEAVRRRFEAERQTVSALTNEVHSSLAVGRELEALLAAVKVGRRLQESPRLDDELPLALRARIAMRRGIFETHERQRIATALFRGVTHVAFAPDGHSLFAAGGGGDIRRSQLNGRLLTEWETEHSGTTDGCTSIQNMALSPDGRTLATLGNEGAFALWSDTGKQQLRFDVNPHGGEFCTSITTSSIDFPRRTLTVRDYVAEAVWTFAGKELRRQPFANDEDAQQLPDLVQPATKGGNGWAAQQDEAQALHVTHHGEEVLKLARQRSPAFSHDSKRLATVADSEDQSVIHVWDLTPTLVDPPMEKEPAQPPAQRSIRLGPDTVKLDAVAASTPFSGVISPDGRLAAVVIEKQDGRIALWRISETGNAASGTAKIVEIDSDQLASADFSEALESLAFSPDGRVLASGGSDGTVKLWNGADGQLMKKFVAHNTYTRVTYSPDGRWILTYGDAVEGEPTIQLWSADGEKLDTLSTQPSGKVWFSADSGRVFAQGAEEKSAPMAWDLDVDHLVRTGCPLLSLYLDSPAAAPEDQALCANVESAAERTDSSR